MKKLLLTLLCAITVGAASAWGASVTFECPWNTGWSTPLPTSASTKLSTHSKTVDGTSYTVDVYNANSAKSYKKYRLVLNKAKGSYIEFTNIANPVTSVSIYFAQGVSTNAKVTVSMKPQDASAYTSIGDKSAVADETTENKWTISSPSAGCSYKIENTASNQVVISKIVFTFAEAATNPKEVTANGSTETNLTVIDGGNIEFAAEGAAKLQVNGEDHPNPFTQVVNFNGAESLTYTVIPYNSDASALYTEGSKTFTVNYKKAEQPGKPTLTPGAGAVAKGSVITFEATNATKYYYKVNGGDAVEAESNTYTVDQDEAFTLEVWGANNDWIDGGEHTVANYSIFTGYNFKLVTASSQISDNSTYILIGKNESANTYFYMAPMATSTSKFMEAVQDKDLTSIPNRIVLDEEKYSKIRAFVIESNSGNRLINLGTKYLGVTNVYTDGTSNTDLKAYTIDGITATNLEKCLWTISFADGQTNATISIGNNELQYNATNPRFKTYYSNQSAVYLYKLVTEEEAEVPAELWMHGHFYDRYYDLSQPVEMKKDGNVFTATGIQLGGNSAVTDGDYGCVFTTHVPAGAVAHAPGKRFANHASNWAEHTEGYVLDADGLKAASDVNSQDDLKPITHEKGEGVYDVKVDFNDAANPVVTLDYKSDVTGIEGVTVEDNAAVEYFNLQGVRVANPSNGVFIRRQGNAVSKVVL